MSIFEELGESDDEALRPDLYTYNTLMTVFSNAGMLPRALQLLEEAKAVGLCPDVVTYRRGRVLKSSLKEICSDFRRAAYVSSSPRHQLLFFATLCAVLCCAVLWYLFAAALLVFASHFPRLVRTPVGSFCREILTSIIFYFSSPPGRTTLSPNWWSFRFVFCFGGEQHPRQSVRAIDALPTRGGAAACQ